ncbi:MAG: hypothetical protein V4494_07595 [Chlamydiota bacterium]
MYLLFILLTTILPTVEQESAIEPSSAEIGEANDLFAHQHRAENHFIHHQFQEAIEDLSYVIDNLNFGELQERKTLLRCLCIRHLCYCLLNNHAQAADDLNTIKPLLLDHELQEDFPDYIEGLRFFVSNEESKES